MSTKKLTTSNNEEFPPLEATPVIDLDPQSEQIGTNEPSTWKVVGKKPKSHRNGHTAGSFDNKSYRNALRIDTTMSR